MRNNLILVVEDEPAIRELIKFALEPAGFEVNDAEGVAKAKLQMARKLPDLIVLDWMLPGISGIEFIRQLKKERTTQNIPIIILTAKAEEDNKVKGLETGADDYIIKPFSPRELVARIKTVLRRGILADPAGIIRLHDLCLNSHTHQVTLKEKVLNLTPIEYRLLHFFLLHPNRVYSREQLLDLVWGVEIYIDDRTVDVQIRRLRNRLRDSGYEQYIQTVRGAGYQLVDNLTSTGDKKADEKR